MVSRMAARDPSAIRIFGVAAHIDAGKTTVSERMLFVSGVQYRPGLVDEGTTIMDHEEEERERGITIHSAAIDLPWKKRQFTLIDTPGHVDFTAEVERCMRVLDGCVLVLDSSNGVEAQSETVWRQAQRHGVRAIAFLNKLDKVGADWEASLQSIRDRLGVDPVSVQMPWIQEDGEIRLVDLVHERVFRYEGEGAGADCIDEPWPEPAPDDWVLARAGLAETIAGIDEELLDCFVEDEHVPVEALVAAIRRQTLARMILPVLGGAALRGIGVEPLLDAVSDYLPSPLDVEMPRGTNKQGKSVQLELDPQKPLGAQVFKVVATRHGAIAWVRVYQGRLGAKDQVRNVRAGRPQRLQGLFRLRGGGEEAVDEALAGDIVAVKGLKDLQTGDALCAPKQDLTLASWDFPLPVISMAVEARKSEDRDRLEDLLALLATEDPTMAWRVDDETGQLLISGMGELHLEILAHKLQRDFRLDVQLGTPRVAYRESIRKPIRIAKRVEHLLAQKEIRCYLDVEFAPSEDDQLPRVVDAMPEGMLTTPAGAVLRELAPRALHADLVSGFAHGYPATKLLATIHAIGEAETALPAADELEAALSLLVREMGRSADVRLLEPWMKLEVQVPEEHLSPVLGDIQASGGEVHDVQVTTAHATISGFAPLSKLLDFTTRLRSVTAGRGASSMTLDSYQDVPRSETDKILGV